MAASLLFLVGVSLHGETPSNSLDEATCKPITIHFTEGKHAPFDVRIVPPAGISWPGENPQTVEVYKDGKKASSTRVGGEPVMIDAWGAVDTHTGPEPSNTAYIYILCEHRRRAANAIYMYEVKDDLTVAYAGLVFTKPELSKETEQSAATNR